MTGYRITPYRNGVAQAPVTVGNVTSRVVAGLDNGVSYRFTVAAINAVGRGPESASSASVVSGVVPAAPTNVQATSQRGQATVTWTAPPAVSGLPVTGYSMVVVADGVRLQAVDIGQGTSEVVTSLRAGVLYRFEVAARERDRDGAVLDCVEHGDAAAGGVPVAWCGGQAVVAGDPGP